MVSRDYRKELGLKSSTRTVPLPFAIAILITVGALAWLGVARLPAGASHSHSDDPAAKPVAAEAKH